jgi:hypothetical protein
MQTPRMRAYAIAQTTLQIQSTTTATTTTAAVLIDIVVLALGGSIIKSQAASTPYFGVVVTHAVAT